MVKISIKYYIRVFDVRVFFQKLLSHLHFEENIRRPTRVCSLYAGPVPVEIK